ncbi:MAG: 50S ribosomal protein L15 [Rhodomicrobiaceae bacterium]
MQLNELKDKENATKARKRVGRGVGSGLGKTAGRGQKGQKSRSGVAINGFEGGQNPLHMRLPKRGFNNLFRLNFAEVNLDDLQRAIGEGKLDASKVIDGAALVSAGLVRRQLDGVRVLGRGELTSKVDLEVAGASAGAVKAIEAAGGSIQMTRPAKKEVAGEEKSSPKKKKSGKSA